MKRGILVYDHFSQEWRVWIGQKSYWIDQGYSFELRIQNKYYHAYLEKDFDWFIKLEHDVILVLHNYEVYKVRVEIQNFIPVDAPF